MASFYFFPSFHTEGDPQVHSMERGISELVMKQRPSYSRLGFLSAMSSLLYTSFNKASLHYTVTTKALSQSLERTEGIQQHKNLLPLIPALGQNNRTTLSNELLIPSLPVSSLKDEQVRSERKICTGTVTPETTHCESTRS